jgi:hypothetical protein
MKQARLASFSQTATRQQRDMKAAEAARPFRIETAAHPGWRAASLPPRNPSTPRTDRGGRLFHHLVTSG